jgi:hypothetical protein
VETCPAGRRLVGDDAAPTLGQAWRAEGYLSILARVWKIE